MSVKVTTWVFDHSQSRNGDRVVLLVLADHADDERWECWPSQGRMARKANMATRSVKRCIDNLVRLGEVKILTRGTGRVSSRYRITPTKSVTPTTSVTPDAGGTPSPHQVRYLRGTTSVTQTIEEHIKESITLWGRQPKVVRIDQPESTNHSPSPTRCGSGPADKGIRSDIDSQTELFRNHYEAKGESRVTWVPLRRSWLIRADGYAAVQTKPGQSKSTTARQKVIAQMLEIDRQRSNRMELNT